MSATVIDRRLNSRDKHISSRQKFIKRAKEQVKRAMNDALKRGKIKDFDQEQVKIPVKDLDEPTFQHDYSTGNKEWVAPGNKDYVEGDYFDKPRRQQGQRGSEASEDEGGEDEFSFILTHDEFMDLFFEDMELPDLHKKQIQELSHCSMKRAGYSNSGNPSNLDLRRTLKNSIGRRIGLRRPDMDDLLCAENALVEAKESGDSERVAEALTELNKVLQRRKAISWLDPVDVRFKAFTPQPVPISRAVMFCIMDVSGSMTEREKDIAKRFFILLNLFLRRKYEKVDIVFIRHHAIAEECSEEDFFYKQESGGTKVSTALVLANSIIKERYPNDQWNIYVAQASDGDNFAYDNEVCVSLLKSLLNQVQYYAYLDIPNRPLRIGDDLLDLFESLQEEHSNLATKVAFEVNGIWEIFRELFERRS